MTGATSAQRDGDGTEAAAPDSGQLEIFISLTFAVPANPARGRQRKPFVANTALRKTAG
jgi:hypothetical protein